MQNLLLLALKMTYLWPFSILHDSRFYKNLWDWLGVLNKYFLGKIHVPSLNKRSYDNIYFVQICMNFHESDKEDY